MPSIPPGNIPDPVDGWPDEFSTDGMVSFETPVIRAAARWWSENFVVNGRTLFPRDIADRLAQSLPGKPRCIFTAVSPGAGRVSVELESFDGSANRIWFSGQSIELVPDRRIFSDLVFVSETRQREGTGRRIMSNCYGLARDLALNQLALSASWVGAYSWLRLGFVPTPEDWEGPLKAYVVGRLYALKGVIAPEAFNRSLRVLSSMEPKAAWVLADDPTAVQLPGDERPSMTLGKALLADCSATWYGAVAFDDDEAVERFEDYTGWVP